MKIRFSIMTLNLWNTEKLNQRVDSIIEFFSIYQSDIICLQELREETRSLLDKVLINYERVHDSFIGWRDESNIYYNKEIFNEVEHGRINLIMPEVNRGLFYLRLKEKNTNQSLFISTIHLTHQGNADEKNTSYSYRQDEARIVASSLNKLIENEEPAIVCGDFNDPYHPSRIISSSTDFTEVFKTLRLEAPVTFPCSSISKEYDLVESIDKIMHNKKLSPILASSPRMVLSCGISDHYPVIAIFEIK